MSKPNICIVDDQRDVLTAVRKDLTEMEEHFMLVECESASEAKEVLEEIDGAGEITALVICDHIMAKQNGVDFLIELNQDDRFQKVKKLLLTGLATHKDTITAINMARIDRYLEKPWEPEALVETVKILLTEYFLDAGIDYQPYLNLLHQPTLYERLKTKM